MKMMITTIKDNNNDSSSSTLVDGGRGRGLCPHCSIPIIIGSYYYCIYLQVISVYHHLVNFLMVHVALHVYFVYMHIVIGNNNTTTI